MNKSAALRGACRRPGRNAPDLGFPKRQLLLVAKVQGHILSIIHQGLGTSMAGDRPLPAVHRPSGHDPLCGRGPSPPPLSRPLGVQRRPKPRLPHPSPPPPLPPSFSQPSGRLPASLHYPPIPGIPAAIPASSFPEPPPGAHNPASGCTSRCGRAGMPGGQRWWARGGSEPEPPGAASSQVSGGAGRAGPRAQSPVGEVGSAARGGRGLEGSHCPWLAGNGA